MSEPHVTRREFVQTGVGVAAAGMLMMSLAESARAEDEEAPDGPPVTFGLIGCGQQGRALAEAIGLHPKASLKTVCDVYEPACEVTIRREAPEATSATDYRRILDDPAIEAVIIATPTHLHRQIALDAVAAGKHVYCEAPLAHTIDDARAIAAAGAGSAQVFQSGLQLRCSPLYRHAIRHFIYLGALDRMVECRAQWHRKSNYVRPGATPERTRQLNWRLNHEVSLGLAGEEGIHQFDAVGWSLRSRPKEIYGASALLHWRDDGRRVADTANALLTYPDGERLSWAATLGNSYGHVYELLQGTHGTVFLRDDRAWFFKESDAPQLGWEVYAHKEKVGDDIGIVLVANATKLLEEGLNPSDETEPVAKGTLFYAIEAFLAAIWTGEPPLATAKHGYEATVVAIKSNEAITGTTTVALPDELYHLG